MDSVHGSFYGVFLYVLLSVFTTNHATAKPNFILINTDDLNVGDIEFMPMVQEHLVNKGTVYTNSFVPDSICCPSRVSLLRGQYSHNHGVLSNQPPEGSFSKFLENGLEQSTIATWMDDAGYITGLYGKVMNAYPPADNRSYIPPGWDNWFALMQGQSYFGHKMNHNGVQITYGKNEADYITDILRDRVVSDIEAAASIGEPFFFYIAPTAPHTPATPAPRHEDAFPGLLAPRPPSFNELDVTDKPMWLQLNPLTQQDIDGLDRLYRKRLQTMLSVDDMVKAIIDTLEIQGQLDNTFIIFTSDNGEMMGEHRLEGKAVAFEESIRVPLVVRGPGVSEGREIQSFALNIDLAPTITRLGGANTPTFVDGKPLKYLLAPGGASLSANDHFVIERPVEIAGPIYDVMPYIGIRTKRYTYVEHSTGETELYDNEQDPYQLENVAGTASGTLITNLANMLNAVKSCSGSSCNTY